MTKYAGSVERISKGTGINTNNCNQESINIYENFNYKLTITIAKTDGSIGIELNV
jgi:hypothetical protein